MSRSAENFKAFLSGAWDSLPLVVAAVPFALIYGALAVAGGLSEAITLAMSVFVFAGSSQFIAVTLLTAAAAAPVIVFTVFVVNLRHMLYSATLMEQMHKYPQWVRLPLAFWLTDETFAVVKEIAMVVAFVGIVVPSLQKPSHWACALVAGVCAVLTRDWPHQTGLLASGVFAIVAGLLVDTSPLHWQGDSTFHLYWSRHWAMFRLRF